MDCFESNYGARERSAHQSHFCQLCLEWAWTSHFPSLRFSFFSHKRERAYLLCHPHSKAAPIKWGHVFEHMSLRAVKALWIIFQLPPLGVWEAELPIPLARHSQAVGCWSSAPCRLASLMGPVELSGTTSTGKYLPFYVNHLNVKSIWMYILLEVHNHSAICREGTILTLQKKKQIQRRERTAWTAQTESTSAGHRAGGRALPPHCGFRRSRVQ